MIEVDIDDPVGSVIARVAHVLNTPTVVHFEGSRWGAPIVGRRSADELRDLLGVA